MDGAPRVGSIAAATLLSVIIAALLRPNGKRGADGIAASGASPLSHAAPLTALKKSALPSAMPRRKAKLEPAQDEPGQFDLSVRGVGSLAHPQRIHGATDAHRIR